MSQGTNFVANLQTNTSQSGAQSPIPRFHLPSTIRTKYYSFVFVDRPADKVSHPAIFSFKSQNFEVEVRIHPIELTFPYFHEQSAYRPLYTGASSILGVTLWP